MMSLHSDIHLPRFCGSQRYRILFGRLRSKSGSKFQGKASTASRSSIILRFLAGCQPEELGMFIDLLLEPLCHHGQGSNIHEKPTVTWFFKSLLIF